tara:strand:- start:86 stop:232 length:147 start_codon:yes stop_codon:yes gene_type:complete
MEEWLKSLSKTELKKWVVIMNSPLNMFLNSPEDKKNILLAKQILKMKG